MSLLKKINTHWGWSGLKGTEIVARNAFGNILVIGQNGTYWRICPEELTCEVVAKNPLEFFILNENEAFQADWEMSDLVDVARLSLGDLKKDWVYSLVIPGVLDGPYESSNIRSVSLEELIEFSGDWALAIKDLPDGEQIRLRVID